MKSLDPDKPLVHLMAEQTTATSFAFRWDPPKNPYGEIKSYDIFVKFSDFFYHNPINCNQEFKTEVKEVVRVEADRNYTFYDALPNTAYNIMVNVLNSGDLPSGFSEMKTSETLSGLSLRNILKINTLTL